MEFSTNNFKRRFLHLMIVIIYIFSGIKPTFSKEQVREMYNFGHMCNSIKEADRLLKEGANAIEVDVQFDKKTGHATNTFHGYPCDFGRICDKSEKIIKYLTHISEVATPGNPKFVKTFTGAIWLDLKLTGVRPLEKGGQLFGELLNKLLFKQGNNIQVILESTDASFWPFVKNTILTVGIDTNRTKPRIGFATTGDNKGDFDKLLNLNNKLENPAPAWIGGGRTNWLGLFSSTNGLRTALKIRDSSNPGHVRKAMTWTRDLKKNIRKDLMYGTDVIITNKPKHVNSVLREAQFRTKYRLATRDDDAFKYIKGHGASAAGCFSIKVGLFHVARCRKEPGRSVGSWCTTSKSCKHDETICTPKMPCAWWSTGK